MRVFIDMDGVLSNFEQSFKNELLALGFSYRNEQSWKLTDRFGNYSLSSNSRHSIVNAIMNKPGFWKNMEIMQDADLVINNLLDDPLISLYISTTPWFTSNVCIVEKIEWIKNNLPKFPLNHIIFINDKYLLNGDVIVDDRPEHIIKWQGPHAICYASKQNNEIVTSRSDSKCIWKVFSWKSIYDILTYIKDKMHSDT